MKKALKFLVDVNLPRFFRFFNSPEFTHVVDLDPRMKDSEIWRLALEMGFTVLTKDADFYDRCMLAKNSPKVVYFKLGNHTLQQLHDFFGQHWDSIMSMLPESRLMLVEKDKISVVIAEIG